MILASTVRQKLSETAAAEKKHELTIADEGGEWSLYLTAERRDSWSTVAWELSLRSAGTHGDLTTWARRIAQESTGLLEPLGVIEIDAANNKALLRSNPPSESEGKVSYYELVLQGTSSVLARRFEGAHASTARRQVPFALTNEVLVKWIGVLAGQ